MYNSIIDAFEDFSATNSRLYHLGYCDKAWNVNKLAHIAHKQGRYDVYVSILEKMYGHSNMEVQEAFVKISEQANAYLEMKGELSGGLNLINSTVGVYVELFRKLYRGSIMVESSELSKGRENQGNLEPEKERIWWVLKVFLLCQTLNRWRVYIGEGGHPFRREFGP